MPIDQVERRQFLKGATIALAATAAAVRPTAVSIAVAEAAKPALLGGTPVRTEGFPSWPVFDSAEEELWVETLRKKAWYRFGGGATNVTDFEKKFAEMLGVKHCLAIANGTSALIASLNALDIGPGDEVIVPPYTFSATINAVFMHHALPVFVDTDINTFQIDATKIEAALTENTRCMIPVHLGGAAYDVDAVAAIATNRNIAVVEDACQSHLGEWRSMKFGNFGATGCYSFQVSKNISCGDGGAMVTNDDAIMHAAYAFHSNGRGYPGTKHEGAYARHGANLRLTEFQGAILLGQIERVEAQSKTRETNAAHLTSRIGKVPGITPVKPYEGCTRNAYHLYMFRYDPEQFAGLSRADFLKALSAEGIPGSTGYRKLNEEPYIRERVTSRTYMKVYGKKRIDEYLERIPCPENDKVTEQAVWFTQNMLLGPREDMDQIADAIEKIHAHAKDLVNA
ncbi:MAG: DegT/DnrJ/EryC1/StrS family aminotransferase [Candidatus Hydrogenedentes bacterium]|nr:DegT/DnrJ/EryC1/StrS family aminotransferase [Candidatus Hydrogenedentota bacterium]